MTLFHLWDLPGDVLAAPESASGLDRCNLSLSLSLSLSLTRTVTWDLPGDVLAAPESALCGWIGVLPLSLSLHAIGGPNTASRARLLAVA